MANGTGYSSGALSSVCLSQNEEFYVSGGANGMVSLHQVGGSTGSQHTLAVHSTGVASVHMPKDDLVFVGCANGSLQCVKVVRDADEHEETEYYGKSIWKLDDAHQGYDVTCVASADGGRLLASSGKDGMIRLWDAEAHRQLTEVEAHKGWVKCVQVGTSTDSGEPVKIIISGGRDKIIKLWDVRVSTAREIHSFRGHTGWVHSVALCEGSGTPKIVSCSGDRTVRIWNLSLLRQEHVLEGHEMRVWSTAVDHYGRVAVSGSSDGTMRAWYMGGPKPTGRVIAEHDDGILAVSLSSSGALAVCGTERGSANEVWLNAVSPSPMDSSASSGAAQRMPSTLKAHTEDSCTLAGSV
mmetsp:Transcript_8105/g.24421  ORF Transcript_8105/g.24421 Transcript_8105/m.24421 type:complete len:353 (-) Transcript_8105:2163-3221(-)